MKRLSLVLILALAAAGAQAQVHFGSNVYIGGHDVSHQTFDRRHRGEFHLYNHEPRRAGCAVRRDADGAQTKVCRYKVRRR